MVIEMMAIRKQIKKDGKRMEIPDVAPVQSESILIKVPRGKNKEFDLQVNYEETGRRIRLTHKKRGRRLKLEAWRKSILVVKERKEIPTISVAVEGHAYSRAHVEARGYAQERSLRHGKNLETMVLAVRHLVQSAIKDGVYLPLDRTCIASNRGLSLIHGLCAGVTGLNTHLFQTMGGKQMKNGFGFKMIILQFFRDSGFAGEVVAQAARDYYAQRQKFSEQEKLGAADMVARHNLHAFSIHLYNSVIAGIEEGYLNFKTGEVGAKNSIHDVEAYFRRDASLMRECSMPNGASIQSERFFSRAVDSFFHNTELAAKIIGMAIRDSEKKE
ncbi:MAG: hypothetical protein WC861_03550 [Candidatus Micrarchaeia archaeon]|jgi:hypothetical protein